MAVVRVLSSRLLMQPLNFPFFFFLKCFHCNPRKRVSYMLNGSTESGAYKFHSFFAVKYSQHRHSIVVVLVLFYAVSLLFVAWFDVFWVCFFSPCRPCLWLRQSSVSLVVCASVLAYQIFSFW